MRGRVITATLLVAVGLVWIGQGLGLLRGSSFMVGDVRWAVAGTRGGRDRRGDRHQREAGAPPGLSHPAQVASAGPAVTALSWRTSGSRIRRVSRASRSTISASPIDR